MHNIVSGHIELIQELVYQSESGKVLDRYKIYEDFVVIQR